MEVGLLLFWFFSFSSTLWLDAASEDAIARIVTTWMITLEKQGCSVMVKSGEYFVYILYVCVCTYVQLSLIYLVSVTLILSDYYVY